MLSAAKVTEAFGPIAMCAERSALAVGPHFSRHSPSGDAGSVLAVTKASRLEPTVHAWAKERVHIAESGNPHGQLTSIKS